MSNDARRPHAEMLAIAESLVELLRPHCEWIEIGGSLRRGKAMVGDVEIVAIPKPSYLAFTDKLLHEGKIGKFIYSNDLPRWGDTYRGMNWKSTKCEVFLCDEWNRGFIQWLRTGPGDGNTLVVTRMKYREAPFRVHDGYVWHGSEKLYIPDEATWFSLLGIPYMTPAQRTEDAYAKVFSGGHQWGKIPHHCMIFTGRIDAKDDDLLDVTVKSSSTPEGKALAPEWDMVMGVKEGRITEAQYTEKYLALLRERYKNDPSPFLNILKRKRVVLACYCSDAPGTFCHRHIAVDVLEKIAAAHKITVLRGGELVVKPEQLSMF